MDIGLDYAQIRTGIRNVEIDDDKFDIIPANENPFGLVVKRLKKKVRAEIKKKTGIPMERVKLRTIGPYVSIGITSKLLSYDYSRLITKDTIASCLESLVEYGVLESIDTQEILDEAELSVVEITNDFILSRKLGVDDYRVFAKAVRNPFRWQPIIYKNGFWLMKAVKEDKEIIAIYDKNTEWQLPKHQLFKDRYNHQALYNNPGSYRLEFRLFSCQAIRNRFGGSNKIKDVLSYQPNPISKVVPASFIVPESIKTITKPSKPHLTRLNFAAGFYFDHDRIIDAIDANFRRHNRIREYTNTMKVVLGTSYDSTKSSLNMLRELIDSNSLYAL